MPKVFISYSHKDENWKKRLQTQLAVLEYQGLLSVWEDRQIAAGDDWYPRIEHAINAAHVAILLISADFLSSKFIQGKEVPPLLDRRKTEGLRVIPLILKPCPWQTVPWLSKIQGRPIDNKPLSGFNDHEQEHHLCELVLEINKLIESSSVSTRVPEQPAPQSAAPAVNYDPRNPAFLVPFRQKGKYMVGREQALEKVREQLLEGKPTSIGQTALFQGMGGLGKTQLAVEYAYQYRDAYPNGVYWIIADENIDAQLTRIAVEACWVAPASEHAIKLDIARHRIKSYSGCLIVFDNLEAADVIRDYLPESSATPHILVTSRSEQPEFTDIKLDLLDDAQSYLMLVQEARRYPATPEEETAAREIAALLGGLPLALELAGAYLEHRPIGWCAYRDLLRANLQQALPIKLASLTKHEADLFKTLRISEREIGAEPLLAQVLDLLTWSGSMPMGLALMAQLLDAPTVQLHGALSLGVALRLLQQSPGSERYAIHRLVQEVRRRDQPLELRREWADTIAQRLGDWFEAIRDDFRELATFEQEFEHLRAWQAHSAALPPIAIVRLLWLQAYPAHHRGRYDEALRIVQQALSAYEPLGLEHTALEANLLNDLSACNNKMGTHLHARGLSERALEVRRKLYGEQHSDIATSLSNLSTNYLDLRNPQRALELGQQALDMRRKLFGEQHPDIANSLNNLASYYAALCNPQRSLELGQQALDMRRKLFGEQHPDIANSLSNLAGYHSKLGNLQRALELGQQGLGMRRELLGATHPDTIISLQFVAKLFFANPFTAGRGKTLVEEHLRLIPHDHSSRAELQEFLASQKGFRKPTKSGQGKKSRKRR